MDALNDRIELLINQTISSAADGPPRLGAAMRHAVLGKASRLRPKLCLAVAAACGEHDAAAADAAAVALELVHCASLVHDDLPCFDDAPLRRGVPSVQKAFGEATAVLVGDALLVLAFQTLARAPMQRPESLGRMIVTLAEATGHPNGIIAGQAWESEPKVALLTYHHAKTAALFEAACALGAIAAGADERAWREVGRALGRAYQVADDIVDAIGSERDHGKACGRDAEHGRPNAVAQLGEEESFRLVERLLTEATDVIPPCPHRGPLRAWLATASLGVLKVRRRGDVARAPRAGREATTAVVLSDGTDGS